MSDFLSSIVWGGTSREITQPWGGAPNGDRRHCGIDIAMLTGTSIYAARPGTVIARGSGFLGITVDGEAQEDWYLHINASVVALGWHVERKQPIALSGAVQVPGGPPVTGPHLHFEVQTGALDVFATSLDPIPVLLGDNMPGLTPEEHQMLLDIHGAFGTAPNQTIGSILADIKRQIAALPAGVVDLSGVNAQLSDILTKVTNIENALRAA